MGEDGKNIFLRIAQAGKDIIKKGRNRKLSVYANLNNGSIKDSIFYGDIEVFSAKSSITSPLKKHVLSLAGKGDMQILLSPQYSAICSIMMRDPKNTVKELKKIGEETSELKEVVRKLLRKFSHSKDEVIRTYAFNEL